MGSPVSEPERGADEAQHQVTLTRAFYLKTTEVTQGEWQALMGNNPSFFQSCGAACPIEQVNFWDAVAYCNALSIREGLAQCYALSSCYGTPGVEGHACARITFAGLDCPGYRLPTEAEWEYAARAGTLAPFYTGEITNTGYTPIDPNLDLAGHYGGNSGVTYAGGADCSGWYPGAPAICGPHAVAQKQANAWGLHDMLGNVWEWNWDWYGAYSAGAVTDPLGASPTASPAPIFRLIRGGSWFNFAHLERAAVRYRFGPPFRSNLIGFRSARSVVP
jgi:formylglycine-generating enzyme required for sulfatase activity